MKNGGRRRRADHLSLPSFLLSSPVPSSLSVYLRTKGINPEDHPVLPELKRIQTYFNKLQAAEFPEKRSFPSGLFPSLTSSLASETLLQYLSALPKRPADFIFSLVQRSR